MLLQSQLVQEIPLKPPPLTSVKQYPDYTCRWAGPPLAFQEGPVPPIRLLASPTGATGEVPGGLEGTLEVGDRACQRDGSQ